MGKSIIRLRYRKVITAASTAAWDRQVFDDTYQAFSEQIQYGNQRSQTHVLIAEPRVDPDLMNTYMQQLQGYIPDVVNSSGQPKLPFREYTFEIVNAHPGTQEEHAVAIEFYSEPLTWIDVVGTNLLVAYGDQLAALRAGQEVETELIPLQPLLNIHSIQ
ncbi:hypothetical protein [Siphonobacter sp.]|uniref:hypothetical protein n=1 Tax=Siphonobacter sp. TaxID=1869184 RepID=UPI003B3BB69A